MVKDVCGGGKAIGGEEGGHETASGGLSNVEGLGHGAEVDPHACGGGCGDAKGHAYTLAVQSEKLGACGGGGHCSRCSRGMPAFGVVGVADGKAELAFQLEADEKCLQHLGAGGSQFFSQCQDGGDEGCAGVAHAGVVDIIKVQGVGEDAVNEGGGECVGAA